MDDLDRELNPYGFSSLQGAVNTPAEANRFLFIIRKLEEEKDKIHSEWTDIINETNEFYQKKMMAKQRAIDFMGSRVESFVRSTDENLSLPNGKAIVKKVNQVEWLVDDDELLVFVKRNDIPDGAIVKMTAKPNKKAIKEWIGDGESTVLKNTQVKKFYIQLPKEEDNE